MLSLFFHSMIVALFSCYSHENCAENLTKDIHVDKGETRNWLIQ
jgi:hypothetical protein